MFVKKEEVHTMGKDELSDLGFDVDLDEGINEVSYMFITFCS